MKELLLMVFFAMSLNIQAQEWIQKSENGKYGLQYEDGSWFLKPEFDHLEDDSFEGRILVKKNGKMGLLDYSGKYILKLEYDEIYPTHNSEGISAFASKKNKWGGVDIHGNWVMPMIYEFNNFEKYCYLYIDVGSHLRQNAHVVTSLKGKYGILDMFGKTIFPFEYDLIYSEFCYAFDEPIYYTFKNGDLSVYNATLTRTSQTNVDDFYGIYNSDFLFVRIDGKNQFLDPKSLQFVQFSEELFGDGTFCKNGKWGVIDSKGNVVIDFISESPISNGRIYSKIKNQDLYFSNKLYGILDEKGKVVVEAKYDELVRLKYDNNFYHAFKYISENKTESGIIDSIGAIILPFSEGSIYENKFIFIRTTQQRKKELFNRQGISISNEVFDDIEIQDSLILFHKKLKWGLMEVSGVILSDPFFDEIVAFDEGFFVVRVDGKYGIINKKAETIVPFKYSGIKFSNGKSFDVNNGFYLQEGGDWFLFNSNGTLKLMPEMR